MYDGALSFSFNFPDSKLAGGCIELSTEKPIRIGRLPECEIYLSDSRFSRIQATLYRRFSRWFILDGGIYEPHDEPRASVNGVWVNAKRLTPGDDKPIKFGDRISFGLPEAKILFTPDCDLTLIPDLYSGPGWPEFKPSIPMAATDPELLQALQGQQQPPEAEEPPQPPAGLEIDSLWDVAGVLLAWLGTTPQGIGGWANRILIVLLLVFAVLVAAKHHLWIEDGPRNNEQPSLPRKQ